MADQAEVMVWLSEQPSVSFVTRVGYGEAVIALTRDADLVHKLEQRDGVSARWYDRTIYSTQRGEEPTWEAEVVFGPRFWEEP